MNFNHPHPAIGNAVGRPESSAGLAVPMLFAAAVRYHQAGQLPEAERLYKQILTIDPRHADAMHLRGVAASQAGHHAAAARLIREAIRLRNNVPFYYISLGNVSRAEGKLTEAVKSYRHAVALRPDFPEALCNLAGTLKALNQLPEAAECYERALALKPDLAEIHNDLGSVLRDQNKLDDAITHYQRAITLKPAYPEAHNNLGNAFKVQREFGAAESHYERAIALRPNFPEAHNNLGLMLKELGRFAEAVAHYQQAIALRPDYPDAYNNLGTTLKAQGKLADAMEHYQRALALKPDFAEAHNNLGNALREQNKLTDAVAHYQRALVLRPGFAAVYSNLGNALEAQGKLAGAVANYRRAIALKPDFTDAYNNLGNTYRDQGNLEDARRCYETAIELAPRVGLHYRHLFDLGPIAAGDRYFAAAEKLAEEMPSLPAEDQRYLNFALGKAYADLERHARSFHHFLAGNALMRRELVYDEPRALGFIDRIRSVFTSELMERGRGLGDPSAAPVFVLGMPRSGTTLVEQILASHPKVFGGGELEDFERAVANLNARGTAPPFPEIVPALSGEVLRQLGATYLDSVGSVASKAERMTDKMPGNFHFVGLMHLALPNARIIHVRRDPIDTCLSCFMLLFRIGQPYSYDLRELGRYYRAYDALMEHWKQVLPAGVMLEVRYEDVVADVERQARRIVAHCGLEWDSACLDFHKADRPVRTASAVQVRQPIYAASVGRWRSYRDQLAPLISELGAAV